MAGTVPCNRVVEIEGKRFEICEVPRGTGDCFFLALCEHEFFKGRFNHDQLRTQLVDRIFNRITEEGGMENSPLARVIRIHEENVLRYLHSLRRQGTYGGTFEAFLVSYIYPVNVSSKVPAYPRIGDTRELGYISQESFIDFDIYRVPFPHGIETRPLPKVHIIFEDLGPDYDGLQINFLRPISGNVEE